jgi:ubiquinone/menaquinone biosynthesis C-methylase UbiE
MTVLDVGCGVGWFAVPTGKMVGDRGKVIAVDLQEQMLLMLRHRPERAGVIARVETHTCEQNRLGIAAEVDFALLFAMLHEVPDQECLLREVWSCLKPDGKWLLAEPPLHVSGKRFAKARA